MARISVVVPAYNIEDYLADCLESIAEQTVRDLEVIVVDDGSTDATPEIAAAYAARDSRFRVLSQPNGGLGRARNVGAAQVHGEFLSFVDGDDVLPRQAYETLLRSLDQTGSDFATGNVHRFDSTGSRQSPMFDAAFRTSAPATHVSRFPDLLKDRIAPNKLWRRSFWDEHEFSFPEGVLHEDIVVAVPAHVLATSVDVISEPCYLYRNREGGDLSITQRRLDPRTITDRARAVDTVSRFLADRGDRKLKRRYDETCAAQDFRYTLQRLDEADDDFRRLFLDLVNDFFDRSHRGVFDGLPALDRLKYHFVRRRLVPELLEVLKFDKSGELNRTRDLRRGRKIYGRLPFHDDSRLRVPRRVFRLREEISLRGRVDDVWWEGERLCIEGHAYLTRIEMSRPGASRIGLTLECGDTGQALDLPVERISRPDVTAAARETVFDYEWSGFRTSVAAADLRPWGSRWRDAVWRLTVDVRAGGLQKSRRLSTTRPGRAQRPDFLVLDGARIMPTTASGRFGVVVDTVPATIDGWHADSDVLQLEGSVRRADIDQAAASLLLERDQESGRLSYPASLTPDGRDRFALVARIPLVDVFGAVEVGDQASHAEDSGDGLVWTLSLQTGPDATSVALAPAEGIAPFQQTIGAREVLLGTTRLDRLTIIERGLRAVATSAGWVDDDTLRVSGSYAAEAEEGLELVLRAQGRVEQHVFPVTRSGAEFTVDVTPARIPTLAGELPLSAGSWDVQMHKTGTRESTAPLQADRSVVRALPVARAARGKDFVLRYEDFDNVTLDVSDDLTAEERGGFNQTRLQTVEFPAFVREGLRDAVLFESYGAMQFSDSPRAVYEELARRGTGLDLLWSVADGQTELPPGLTAVRRGSREWFEATARSRYVVTSVYRPLQDWLRPHPDQVVLQTWHGAPFKKIGFDSERIERLAGRGYHDRLERETSRWNHLISPNAPSTPILRSAFHYDGDVLETGYPRVDILFGADRAAKAEQVRARLGLPAGKKVVLYAPTYRDNMQYRKNRFRLDLRLDLAHAEQVLGDDHVLLVRRHAKIVDDLAAHTGGFVQDVSLYPDVNELLLLTDVLITDYSSLMFDFANTGRPMVFFAYDLEEYRDGLRGFYFDVGVVPGPLLRTSAEVVAAVADADSARSQHAQAYKDFQHTFCSFDDGTASARVVTAVFGPDAGPG